MNYHQGEPPPETLLAHGDVLHLLNVVICMSMFAFPASQFDLPFALILLGLTLGFGCAMTALLFYRIQRKPLSSTGEKAVPGTLAASVTRPRSTSVRTTTGSVVRSGQARTSTARTSTTTRRPSGTTRTTARQTSDDTKKQIKHFETLLSNLEREFQQGTVSTTIYRKLKREYQERIKTLRSRG